MNYSDLLLSPIAAALGVDAVLTPAATGSAPVAIKAIDKTRGVDPLIFGETELGALAPAAKIMVRDLVDAGLEIRDVSGATIEINGTSWIVRKYRLQPTPGGKLDGALLLLLQGAG